MVLNFKPTDATVQNQPLVLSGKALHELSGLQDLSWGDYSLRRELIAWMAAEESEAFDEGLGAYFWAGIQPNGYPMGLKYTNRVMQTDDVLVRSFRVVGLTEEDGQTVAAQYSVWGEELTRLADVEVQLIER